MKLAQSRSSDNANYTFTFDWTVDLPIGYVHTHIDYAFMENITDQLPNVETFELAVSGFLDDRKDLNTCISLTNDDETLEVGLWARNLLDERYVETIRKISAGTLGTQFARINRGR